MTSAEPKVERFGSVRNDAPTDDENHPSMNPSSKIQTRDGTGEMFDRIAARYDVLNRLMSLGMDRSWRVKAANALCLDVNRRILDLATGTADLALQVASHDRTIEVTGLDPSRQMLAYGQRKLDASTCKSQIRLIEGDAQSLPFEDRSFDGVCMAFGIRNVPDRNKALTEMARVVRPNGRICILELSEPQGYGIGALARFYVHTVVPWLGSVLSGEREYRYLQRSIAAFPPAKDFAKLMGDCGLRVLETRALTFGACNLYVATPQEH